MKSAFKIMLSPIGTLKLIATNKSLAAIVWETDKIGRVTHFHEAVENRSHPVLLETEHQLDEYFTGKRKAFDIPLNFVGTEFNQRVWAALLTIPYGETRTYGEIAKQIGDLRKARTVGAACAKNPIAIIAPCHRVIGTNGKLTGYAGGLKAKTHLLNLEAKLVLA